MVLRTVLGLTLGIMTEPLHFTRSRANRPTHAQDDLAQRADDISEVSRSAGKVPLMDMSDNTKNPDAALAGMTEPVGARPSAPDILGLQPPESPVISGVSPGRTTIHA